VKTVSSNGERFQILSLDGGGIKGIFSAAVLAAIEDDLHTRVIDHFDLVAGTSTGGILAIGLGLGLTARQMLDFYLQEGEAIFANKLGTASLRQYVSCKFSAAPLETALKRHFGDKCFGHSTKRLVIPSYNLGENDVYIFRTAHTNDLKRDYKVPAWKVALSTSAAPTYFPSVRAVDNLRLIDGGVWANNPSMVAAVEAFGPLGIPLSSLRMLSIGTFEEIADHHKRLDSGGFWQWRKTAANVIMRARQRIVR
jgi:patatin-like phospholipase/acyl hydrolase